MNRFICYAVAAIILFVGIAFAPISSSAAPQTEPSTNGPTTVKVTAFEFTGNSAIQASELQAIIDDFKKKNNWNNKPFYTLTDLKTVAALITAHYQKRGYLLARAIVPEQDIKDGVIKIEILEGSVGRVMVDGTDGVDFTKLTYYKKSYVTGWFRGGFGDKLNELDLEKRLMLLNDTPGLEVKAVLKKGADAGKTDVSLSAEDTLPIALAFEYNNEGNENVSKDRYGAYFSVTDPYLGSTFNLTAFQGTKISDSRLVGIDYSLPFIGTAFRAGVRHIKADYIVSGGKFQTLDIEGKSDITGGYITHSCVRSRAMNLRATLGYDRKHMFEYLLKIRTSNDDLSIGYLRFDFDNIDKYVGRNIVSFTYSHGFEDFHGSLKNNDPDASRLYSSGEFDKFNIEIARVQKIKKYLLLLRGTAQYTKDRLVNPEQFAIGGSATVRGYEVSSFTGDMGYVVSAEIQAPLPFVGDAAIRGQRFDEMVRLAVFIDHGSVKRNKHKLVPGEDATSDITGLGGGIRINIFDRLEVTADVAVPFVHRGLDEREEEITVKAVLKVLKF